jgi:hypothetical protein
LPAVLAALCGAARVLDDDAREEDGPGTLLASGDADERFAGLKSRTPEGPGFRSKLYEVTDALMAA